MKKVSSIKHYFSLSCFVVLFSVLNLESPKLLLNQTKEKPQQTEVTAATEQVIINSDNNLLVSGLAVNGTIKYNSQITLLSYYNTLMTVSKSTVRATSDYSGKWRKFRIIKADNHSSKEVVKFGDKIILQTSHPQEQRKYLMAKEDGTIVLTNKKRDMTHLILVNPANPNSKSAVTSADQLAFRSVFNKYVVSEPDGRVNVNRAKIGALEKWSVNQKVFTFYNRQISLLSNHNLFLGIEGTNSIKADYGKVDKWQKFKIINAANHSAKGCVRFGDKVILQTSHPQEQRKYLLSKEDGTIKLDGKKREMTHFILVNPVDPASKKFINLKKDKIAFKSVFNKYLVAEQNGKVLVNRSKIGGWEQWSISNKQTFLKEEGFRVVINGLYCLQSADGGNGTDEPYLEVFVDGSTKPIKFGARPMNESDRSWWEEFTDGVEALTRTAQQEFWLMPGSVYAEKKVVIKLWEEDSGRGNSPLVDNDDYIGEVTITKSTADNNYILKKFRSPEEGNWNLAYSKHTRKELNPTVQGKSNAVKVRVPVLNQGNEGACVAFATVGALTTVYLNKTKPGSSREELFDPFPLYNRRNKSQYSEGWNVVPCIEEIMRNGIPFKNNTKKRLYIKSYYEYNKDGSVFKKSKNRSEMISPVDNKGYDKMRTVLKSGEPLIATYSVYPDFTAYAGVQGVYGGKIADVKSESGHAVFVVGYNNPAIKSNASPTWTLQNSWKPTWGRNGLCTFAEGACSFDEKMYRIVDFEVVDK